MNVLIYTKIIQESSKNLVALSCPSSAGPDAGALCRGWAGRGRALEAGESRLGLVLGALLILALVLAAYRPILPGSFLMDDRRLIEGENPMVTGALGPFSVWFQTDFALSTFALWAQWLAWGARPGWYHAVNLGASCAERGVVVAFAGAAEGPGGLAGRGDFCGASGGGRFRGANRRVEEHAFAAFLSDERLVLCPL